MLQAVHSSILSRAKKGASVTQPDQGYMWGIEQGRLEAIALRLEAIASRLEAIASRLEAMALQVGGQ